MSACTAEPVSEGPQPLDPSQEARNLRVTLGLLKHRCLFPGPPQAHHWASTAATTLGHSSFDPFQVYPGVPLSPSVLSLSSLYPKIPGPHLELPGREAYRLLVTRVGPSAPLKDEVTTPEALQEPLLWPDLQTALGSLGPGPWEECGPL